jgi:hypothetical protein
MRPEKRKRQRRRKERKKQTYETPFPLGLLTSSLADLTVESALSGCTFEEKVLIASIIPVLLSAIRSTGINLKDAAKSFVSNIDQK